MDNAIQCLDLYLKFTYLYSTTSMLYIKKYISYITIHISVYVAVNTAVVTLNRILNLEYLMRL